MSSISKKSLISLALAIVVLAVSTACFDAESRQSSVSAYCNADSIFRLHIIANSNSAEDQAVKLKVRDAVLEYEAENLDAVSAAKTREELMTHGAELLEIIEGVLRSNGFDYGAQMLVGTFRSRTENIMAYFIPQATTMPSALYSATARAKTGGALCSRRCVY